MSFKSYSQVGQDQWVYDTLVKGRGLTSGLFLDVGANHPIEINNTYGLEQIGWRGILIDNDKHCFELCRDQRPDAVVFDDDVTTVDLSLLKIIVPTGHFNYLSLDVDSATLAALKNLLKAGITFDLATIEDDRYRFGDGPLNEITALLTTEGYKLVRPDVVGADGKSLFETWWLDPKRV